MFETITTPHLCALALVAGAAVSDARTGHIPNWMTLPPLVAAPLAYLAFYSPQAAALSVLAALVCGLVPYLMFRKGAAGGGDVKLLASLGAIAGASFGIETQLFGFAVALVFSLALLTYRGRLLTTLGNALFLGINPLLPKRYRRVPAEETMSTIRMGVPFLLGALLSIWLRTGSPMS